MAARRASKAIIDWAAFAARVPEDQQATFKQFKTRYDAYAARVSAFPEETPKIDWNYYASKIPAATMVSEFQKAHSALKVSYPQDTLTQEIDQQEQQAIEKTRTMIQSSNQRIDQYKKDLKRWEDMMPIHLMTQEEYVLTFPDHAFGIDQKRYQTLHPHDYNPKYGIPGEIGSGHWNIGPDRHKEKKHDDH